LPTQVVAAAFCRLLLDGARLSREFDAGGRWDGHAPGLRPGWIAGRRADLSDAQWRTFRAGLPPLAVALAAFAAASRALRRAAAPSVEAAVRRRAALHAAAAAAFLIYLHGAGAALVFALVAACHAAARLAAGSRHGAAAIWAANMGALAAARYTNGAPAFFASLPLGLGARLGALDALRGAGVRWHVCYNLTALRVLSHGLDLHWRRRAASGGDSDAAQDDAKRGGAPPATPRGRARTPLPAAADYSLLPALAHALYPPLYLAGPLVTFQDYAWQLRAGAGAGGRAAPSLRGALARCAARLLADLAAIEVLTHFLYFNSLAVHRVGARLRPAGLPWGAPEAGLAAWWVLAFMWLKFAAIWRFFRAAALLEGLDPPENMRRCFADNCDAAGFWRGWHASFNRWLVCVAYGCGGIF
jgi:D-alanyl-lipoteichoic acid acyltransferase DltB (MBOAT superfamily)